MKSDSISNAETPADEALPFEKAMQGVEEIVRRLEDGSLSLQESLDGAERGFALVRRCADELKRAERRVKELTEEAGRIRLDDFETDDGQDDSS